jgi:peptide/nickel transport system substrate-binding protein
MQILEQQLQAVGVKAKLHTVSTGAMQSASEKGNFDAYGAHWYMVQPTALDLIGSNYVTDASANYGHYSNDEVDALTKKATATFDEKARNDQLAEIEQLITEDAPGLFLASLNFLVAINPELENFHYNPIYGTYYDRLWRA